jgi:hypothetical protein
MVVGAGVNAAQIKGKSSSLTSFQRALIRRLYGASTAPKTCALHTTACVYTI